MIDLMATIRLHATGPLPADEAWERYAQPRLWPEWAPQIVRVETPAGRIAAGVEGRVVGPLGVSVDFTVDEVDESARRWSWTARRRPVTLRLEHGVEAHAGGTATWLVAHGRLPVLLGYAPVAQFALHRLVTR